jgi:hypothetical protein
MSKTENETYKIPWSKTLKEQGLDIPSSFFSTNTELVQNNRQLLMHIHNIYFTFC